MWENVVELWAFIWEFRKNVRDDVIIQACICMWIFIYISLVIGNYEQSLQLPAEASSMECNCYRWSWYNCRWFIIANAVVFVYAVIAGIIAFFSICIRRGPLSYTASAFLTFLADFVRSPPPLTTLINFHMIWWSTSAQVYHLCPVSRTYVDGTNGDSGTSTIFLDIGTGVMNLGSRSEALCTLYMVFFWHLLFKVTERYNCLRRM